MHKFSSFTILLLTCMVLSPLGGCSTAPKIEDQATFLADSDLGRDWFESNVAGLDMQVANSGGYIIFPDIAQWGMVFTGGSYGRGALCRPDGTLIGWAAVNTMSIGLQAGVQGFKMMMVLEDEAAVQRFMKNQLTGQVGATAVLVDAGAASKASFENGVAIYQGAQSGLMAGVNIGLDRMRYEALDAN